MNLREMNKDMLIKIIETIEEKHTKEKEKFIEKIDELESVLKTFKIEKCKFCEEFVQQNMNECAYCDVRCCMECTHSRLPYYNRYSGDFQCEKCTKKYPLRN